MRLFFRRFFKLRALFFVLCFAMVFSSLAGCKKGIEKYQANISELRDNVFDADVDGMNVFVISGIREEPYILDGSSGTKVDFTVITVTPKEYDPSSKFSYSITIEGVDYTGDLSQHPFGKSFSADINARILQRQITLKIIKDSVASEVVCESKFTADMITAEKAFEIASQRLKTQVKSLSFGSKLNAEVYIRFMANPIDNSGGYYWYVAFVGENDIIYAALINPFSLEVVAVRD